MAALDIGGAAVCVLRRVTFGINGRLLGYNLYKAHRKMSSNNFAELAYYISIRMFSINQKELELVAWLQMQFGPQVPNLR